MIHVANRQTDPHRHMQLYVSWWQSRYPPTAQWIWLFFLTDKTGKLITVEIFILKLVQIICFEVIYSRIRWFAAWSKIEIVIKRWLYINSLGLSCRKARRWWFRYQHLTWAWHSCSAFLIGLCFYQQCELCCVHVNKRSCVHSPNKPPCVKTFLLTSLWQQTQ